MRWLCQNILVILVSPFCTAVSEGDENIYEAIEFRHRPGEADSDVSWGSEFDSSSDSEYEFPSKPLPAPPQKSNILPFILQVRTILQVQKYKDCST